MKKTFFAAVFALLVGVLLSLAPLAAQAQCTMCKSQIEAARQERDDYDVAGLNKGILMSRSGLTEGEAFRRIQKHSMDTRKSMREVAEASVLASEIADRVDLGKVFREKAVELLEDEPVRLD